MAVSNIDGDGKWASPRPALDELVKQSRSAPWAAGSHLLNFCQRLSVSPERLALLTKAPKLGPDGHASAESVIHWADNVLTHTLKPNPYRRNGRSGISLHRMVPVPSDIYAGSFELCGVYWCIDNWGCPYDVLNPAMVDVAQADPPLVGFVLRFRFINNGPPCVRALERVASQWADLNFSLIAVNYLESRAVAHAISADTAKSYQLVNGYYHSLIEVHESENELNWQVTTHHADLMLTALSRQRTTIHNDKVINLADRRRA